jgi:hypothetical protein
MAYDYNPYAYNENEEENAPEEEYSNTIDWRVADALPGEDIATLGSLSYVDEEDTS